MVRSNQYCLGIHTLLITLMLSLPLAWGQAPISYTMQTFDLFPNAVNNFGTVCGQYQGMPGRWKPGWPTPQVLPGAQFPGDCNGVNNYDYYVCHHQPPAAGGEFRACFLAPGRPGITTPRLPAGTVGSSMIAINNVFEAIGFAWNPNPPELTDPVSMLRWQGVAKVPVIVKQGTDTNGPRAVAINKKGLMAGFDLGESDDTSQPWTHARGAKSTVSGYPWGTPMALNDLGWMAGLAGQVWFADGTSTHVPPWCPPGAGAPTGMNFFGINQQVSAVGVSFCFDAASGQEVPYAVRADDVQGSEAWSMADLNSLVSAPNCHLIAAHAISENHLITGLGICDGVAVGFLLTPVVNTAAVE